MLVIDNIGANRFDVRDPSTVGKGLIAIAYKNAKLESNGGFSGSSGAFWMAFKEACEFVKATNIEDVTSLVINLTSTLTPSSLATVRDTVVESLNHSSMSKTGITKAAYELPLRVDPSVSI